LWRENQGLARSNLKRSLGGEHRKSTIFLRETLLRGRNGKLTSIISSRAITGVTGQDGAYLAELLPAKDYVEGMWRMLQQEAPDDYVLATGETRSVREFVEAAFAHIGRTLQWSGKDVDETGVDAKSGATLVKIDPRYFRPTEVDLLIGDATKARTKLGWQPMQTFQGLVTEMMDADLAQARRDAANRS
jgi:GDPmannose 4,6-dehydratase